MQNAKLTEEVIRIHKHTMLYLLTMIIVNVGSSTNSNNKDAELLDDPKLARYTSLHTLITVSHY